MSKRTPEALAREAQRRMFDREPDGRYEVTNLDENGASKTRVQIFGVIGDWWDGLDAATLANQITALDTDEIEVHLNSPGGIAFDGIAIKNALKQHDATVHVMVDGLAASAASIIAMAGDKITMGVGSQLMIHNAQGAVLGESKDMRQVADVLDKVSGSIADVYAAHAGGTRDDWQALMNAETWYTADEAVAAGLADAVEKSKDGKAKDASNAFDLSIFAYAGRDNAPAPHMPPARPAEPTTQKEGVAVSDTLIKGLREQLGIKADAKLDEAGLLAANADALKKQAEPTPAKLPDGVVAIDKMQLDQLQADAAQGRAARDEQLVAARKATINAAIMDGRIHAKSAPQWDDALANDEKQNVTFSGDILAGLPKNTVPVQAKGYTGGVAEHSDDDDNYSNLFGKEA